jgi:cytochrome c oxidase subunit II
LDSHLGIFPASVGAGIDFLSLITVLAIVITVIAFVGLFFSMRRPDETDKHSLAKYELHWTLIILVVVVLFAVSTLSFLPYPYAHSDVKPTMSVDVQAQQFNWCLSPPPSWGTNCQADYQIPAGSTVMFYVRSMDVTHGFGVYSSGGEILFQVQVMPGFNNSIMYQFTQPGDYYIRCLEFCGYGHYEMISQLNVTAS